MCLNKKESSEISTFLPLFLPISWFQIQMFGFECSSNKLEEKMNFTFKINLSQIMDFVLLQRALFLQLLCARCNFFKEFFVVVAFESEIILSSFVYPGMFFRNLFLRALFKFYVHGAAGIFFIHLFLLLRTFFRLLCTRCGWHLRCCWWWKSIPIGFSLSPPVNDPNKLSPQKNKQNQTH